MFFILITYVIDNACYSRFSSLLLNNGVGNASSLVESDMDLRFTFSQKCCLCTRKFKTFSAIQKHAEQKHTAEAVRALDVVFLDNKQNEARVPQQVPHAVNRRSRDFKAGYLLRLAGLTEQINASLNPRLRGK